MISIYRIVGGGRSWPSGPRRGCRTGHLCLSMLPTTRERPVGRNRELSCS